MKIILEKTGKKFYRDWIFRNLNTEINLSEPLAITGPNGSGKSTLLQVVSGNVGPTEGSICYFDNEKEIDVANIFRYVSIAAPYLELIEEFTMNEIIRFHFRFKKTVNDLSEDEIISITGLEHAKNKIYKYFSSGMKQRLKLSLAILSDVKIILLDEPCSNLDAEAIKWYRQLIDKYTPNKIVVVCSNNQSQEFDFCKHHVDLTDLKK